MKPQQSKYWDKAGRTFRCLGELRDETNLSEAQLERIAERRVRQYDAGYMVYWVRPRNSKLP